MTTRRMRLYQDTCDKSLVMRIVIRTVDTDVYFMKMFLERSRITILYSVAVSRVGY